MSRASDYKRGRGPFVKDERRAANVTLPCEVCGVAVFQATARRKRFCSKRCSRQAWHREHAGQKWTASRLSTKSVTTTYTMPDGTQWTTVGYGRTYPEAREDARARLPRRFEPVAEYTSTPETVLRSLRVVA